MRVHLTCAHPTRSAVLCVHAARELLTPRGHAVSVSWPEPSLEEGPDPRIGLNRTAINAADVVVHCCTEEESELPMELSAALRFGTPVVRYEYGTHEGTAVKGEATLVVTGAEELCAAVAEALALTL